MLVLSRKAGQTIVIGNRITVTVLEMDGKRVRVGIDAPDQVRVLRAELACRPPGTPPQACKDTAPPASELPDQA
jgi:carbon storage regulator